MSKKIGRAVPARLCYTSKGAVEHPWLSVSHIGPRVLTWSWGAPIVTPAANGWEFVEVPIIGRYIGRSKRAEKPPRHYAHADRVQSTALVAGVSLYAEGAVA